MPPDVYSLLLTNLQETRREMQEGFRDLRAAVNGYDAARCEAHTDRMHKIETRQDTEHAAREALAQDRLRSTDRGWRLWGAVVAVAALAATIVGVVLR